MKLNANVSAGVAVRRMQAGEGNKVLKREILMVVRPDGLLAIPSGKLENEIPIECARREFEEETGHRVFINGLLKVVTIVTEEGPRVGFIFTGTIGGQVAEAELETRWIDQTEFMWLLQKGEISYSQFHIPALFEERAVPHEVVIRLAASEQGPVIFLPHAMPFPGSI